MATDSASAGRLRQAVVRARRVIRAAIDDVTGRTAQLMVSLGRIRLTALGVFGVIFAASWVDVSWPAEKALHDCLTVLAVILLCLFNRRLSGASFVAVLVFLTLHTIAARWLYSFVPYDTWTSYLFGFRLSEIFGWQRNHFDRLVHFAYGVCAAFVLQQLLSARRRWWRALIAVEVVISTSAAYELLEWGIAELLSPQTAEAYNGQQGDIWDPHKDMALAILGAVVTVTISLLTRNRWARFPKMSNARVINIDKSV